MSEPTVTGEQLLRLRQLDTPTVCNALDLVDPDFDLPCFTSRPLRCIYPELPPMVGFARTATIRAVEPPEDKEAAARLRAAYYDYVAQGPGPTVMVMEDLDGARAGSGCMWGEVNTTIHQRLGCLGVVTNGSIRDVDDNARGFQLLAAGTVPSRAHTWVVDFGRPVSVHGMEVHHGELIHADQHGAVRIPAHLVDQVLAGAGTVTRREQALLAAVRADSFTITDLHQALKASSEIH
ncbi:RraA family protein [Streptomyces formicae]|uniref:Putative 4-hydroxy-4-methyl-2-oxoglutarate aldolase n=1 Tax=Streptomyces formicae TaxID=1616117 RepID=A0ABY3WQJ4_9ACTN|nr:RraA family protein [Streptomyces formicae]UNM13856.1 RraA family protein [Streptomyces formicae]